MTRARTPPNPSRSNWPSDRKSTRLNSSHITTSYAVFCLKKKNNTHTLHAFYQRQLPPPDASYTPRPKTNTKSHTHTKNRSHITSLTQPPHSYITAVHPVQ